MLHRAICVLLLSCVLSACASLDGAGGSETQAPHWVASWASAQQIPNPPDALAPEDMQDKTLRQIVRVSLAGTTVRVRLSNAMGTAPLRISGAHIARAERPGATRVVAGTDTPLLFSGRPDVIIPQGADYWSDPVAFDAAAFTDVAISLHIPEPPAVQTSHPGSRMTSYIAAGNQLAAAELPGAKETARWYFIAGIDVVSTPRAGAIVVIGDSITDGRGSTTDGNDRWTDVLAQRLQADPRTQHLSVLNVGLGGNRILNDGNGPNAVSRFDRDVLSHAGVEHLIVFEGINDLGTLTRGRTATEAEHLAQRARMISAMEQMITRAHAHGIRVYGATILPYAGGTIYPFDPLTEADRLAINEWIRTSGRFDGVIDFDRALQDPANPQQLLPAYDMGDKLHPSAAGHRALGEAVDLALFR